MHSCGVPLISKICGRIFDAAASIRSICLEEPTKLSANYAVRVQRQWIKNMDLVRDKNFILLSTDIIASRRKCHIGNTHSSDSVSHAAADSRSAFRRISPRHSNSRVWLRHFDLNLSSPMQCRPKLRIGRRFLWLMYYCFLLQVSKFGEWPIGISII